MMIHLIDTIGKETGMHLYDDAFVKEFSKKGIKVIVISNFENENAKPVIRNFYHGNILKKISGLVISLFSVLFYFHKNKKDKDLFIYQSFGMRPIDILFIRIFKGYDNFYLIAHDVYDIKSGDSVDPRADLKNKIYRKDVKNIICHSERTMEVLEKIGYSGNMIYYPHFSYEFNKDIVKSELGEDVVESVKEGVKNFLFFGQVRLTKGIDILLDSLKYVDKEDQQCINIIIAGHDKEGLIGELPFFVTKISRYINDSEMNYLFSECDYVLLPYKEIYQSGVLEAVLYFRKPAIMSGIDYFKYFLANYPSFGEVYEPNAGNKLADTICQIASSGGKDYYSEADLEKYQEDHDINRLIEKMNLQ